MNSFREDFLLDPDIILFNHGSFGATPRPVFESYQRWQIELEHNPVKFLQRRLPKLLEEARAKLAEYVHTKTENVIFVTNATFGMNVIIKSLKLKAGDQVLTTDQEYGAINNTWNFMAERSGFQYINHHIPLPVTTREAFVDSLWEGVTPNTRVISLSHITSSMALILPVDLVAKRAREAGIITVVDGAHAPGQIPLDLDQIGADFYVGNLHKWLCAPKGAGFFYTRPEMQRMLEPLVVSHGYRKDPAARTFVDMQQNQGTRDPSAFLAVPDAIRYLNDHNWDQVRADCHALAASAQQRMIDTYGVQPVSPVDANPSWFSQMLCVPLPKMDFKKFSQYLLEELKMEIPVMSYGERPRVRLSVQAYNTPEEVDTLVEAVHKFATKEPVPA